MIIRKQSSRKNKHVESRADRRAERQRRGGAKERTREGGREGRSKGQRQGRRREQGRKGGREDDFGRRVTQTEKMSKIPRRSSAHLVVRRFGDEVIICNGGDVKSCVVLM